MYEVALAVCQQHVRQSRHSLDAVPESSNQSCLASSAGEVDTLQPRINAMIEVLGEPNQNQVRALLRLEGPTLTEWQARDAASACACPYMMPSTVRILCVVA